MTYDKDYWKNEIHKKYPVDCDMTQFKRISEVSYYDHNFYVGFNNDLLYGKSDDDNMTEWYLIKGDNNPIFLGISCVTNKDKLMQISNL